jgi:hypothetical protein
MSTRQLAKRFSLLRSKGSQRRRHLEAERLRGLEVDRQLVLHRRLHPQVGRLLALEDAAGIRAYLAIGIVLTAAIEEQTAGFDGLARAVARGQCVAGRQSRSRVFLGQRISIGMRHLAYRRR